LCEAGSRWRFLVGYVLFHSSGMLRLLNMLGPLSRLMSNYKALRILPCFLKKVEDNTPIKGWDPCPPGIFLVVLFPNSGILIPFAINTNEIYMLRLLVLSRHKKEHIFLFTKIRLDALTAISTHRDRNLQAIA
jgi:hypothetical protein